MSNDKKIDFDKQPFPAAGMWPCTVLSGGVGEETDNHGKPTGRMRARVNVKFDDGPDKGKMATYEDEINAKSSLYVLRSLKAVGWQGKFPLTTVADDIDAWIKKTGGKSTVEVRHIEAKRGKKYDEWVDAWIEKTGSINGCPPYMFAKVNSIGRGPKPLAAPSADALSDAEEQMRRAMEDDGGAPPADDAPHAATGSDDDIPF